MLDNLLTLLIQGGGRLVKDQDLRVLDEGSCDSHALLLTARQLATFQTAHLLESRVQATFSILHFPLVDQTVKLRLVAVFDSCARFESNLELEVLVRVGAEYFSILR